MAISPVFKNYQEPKNPWEEKLNNPLQVSSPPSLNISAAPLLGDTTQWSKNIIPVTPPKTSSLATPTQSAQTPQPITPPKQPTAQIASVPQIPQTGVGTDGRPLGQAPTGMYIDDQGRLQLGEKPTTTPTPTTDLNLGGSGKSIADIMSAYGVDKLKQPTLPAADDYLKEYRLDPETIRKNLEASKAAIAKKYGLEREKAKQNAENRKQSTLSNLYAAGEVNPMSSSFQNVEANVQSQYEDDLRNIDAMEAAEVADAEAAAYGFASNAAKDYRAKYLDEQGRIEKEFDLEKQQISENLRNIQTAINVIRSNKALSTEEEDRTRGSIMDILTNYGGSAFNGIDTSEIDAMEKAAGYPKGMLTNAIKAMKKNELLGRSNIKEVDGSLYNITTDDDGNIKTELLVKGTPKASAESGLTPAQINSTVNSIASAFDNEPIVKTYNETINKARTVEQIINSGVGGPGDLALVFEFMKGLDPTSVVRESEYASASKSGNIFSGVMAQFNGYLKPEGGFLPDKVKQAFNSILQSKLDTVTQQYQNLKSEYQRQIDDAYSGKPRQITSYETNFGSNNQTSIPTDLSNVDWETIN